ncbi:unnamed protein product [Heterobilharzia americana]|nr:unnamed protein product [Heterobilharzia americana]
MNCRFRVVEEVWCDPNPDHDKTSNATASDPSGYDLNADHIAESKAPYTLIGSLVADGLGVTCWWVN